MLTKHSLESNDCLLTRNYIDKIPCGWFFIAYSEDIVCGDVRTISFFNQEWVLFRNKPGEVGLIDAYCPHLGAHIGIGGKVDGDLIRCPFHSWGFDLKGYCQSIPYADDMPSICKRQPVMKSIPTVEKDGIIWGWFHEKNEEPLWAVDALCKQNIKGWTAYRTFVFDVNTSIQDINENSVDYAHLKYVHGHTSPCRGETVFKGIERETHLCMNVSMCDRYGDEKECKYTIDLRQAGPGIQVIRYKKISELLLLFMMTPITYERTALHLAFTHPNYEAGSYEEKLVKDLLAEKVGKRGNMPGVHEDIPIWNHKIYRERPLLCDGDGPIIQFRKWFDQFYIKN